MLSGVSYIFYFLKCLPVYIELQADNQMRWVCQDEPVHWVHGEYFAPKQNISGYSVHDILKSSSF